MNDILKVITCYFCYIKLEVVIEIDLSPSLWHQSISPLFLSNTVGDGPLVCSRPPG